MAGYWSTIIGTIVFVAVFYLLLNNSSSVAKIGGGLGGGLNTLGKAAQGR